MRPTGNPKPVPLRNFYGRRSGKTLRKSQALHLNETLPGIAPKGIEVADNPERTPIDLLALFSNERPVWLEIGFGGGEHLLHMAQTYPDINFIGCEAFINGVAKLVPLIAEHDIKNTRIHMGDARDMLEVLPEASISKAFLLYPDPWPKKRHHSRRFVNTENMNAISKALKPGAELRIATDIDDYLRHIFEIMMNRDDFEWLAESPQDWRTPWADWTRTRYEAKAIREDRTPHYLTFRKF